ncbi:MAG: peptidoglycan-binding protein, partial [Roseovarius sp.]|nr:peptidoglycan-binding protein [Roseovarius sp.]
MTPRFRLVALLAALVLGGCQAALPRMAEPVQVSTRDEAPPGAAPGTCWGQDETPAVVETVTEQIVLQPPEVLADGTVQRPAVYKTETRQQIVKPRKATWFETPCEADLTPEFTASLQRALAARGHYRGAVTGRMDARTRTAIRGFQRPQGLDSGMISLAAARQMGLIALDHPDSGADIDAAPATQVAALSGPAEAAEQPSEDQPDTRRAAEAEA